MPRTIVKSRTTSLLWLAFIAASFCVIPATRGASPKLSAALNGSTSGTLYRGNAAVISVQLMHPDAFEDTLTPIRLELADGNSWTNAMRVEIRKADGTRVEWPLWMRAVIPKTITLDAQTSGQLYFGISPTDSASIAEGAYKLFFILDTRTNAAPGAWSGLVRSPGINLSIASPPANLSDEDFRKKQLNLAEFRAIRNETAAATDAINELLAAQPRNIPAFWMKAATLKSAGDLPGAITAIESAVEIFHQDHATSPEPPRDLLEFQRQLAEPPPSSLQIETVSISNGQINITWIGDSGVSYRIESSVDFRNWRVDASTIPGQPANTWTGAFDGAARFYRIAAN